MTHVRSARIVTAAVIGAVVLTACGQRPGVHVEGGGQVVAAPGQQQPGTGQTGGDGGQLGDGGTAEPGDDGGDDGAQAGGQVGGSTGGQEGTGGGQDGTGGGQEGTGGDQQQQQGQLEPTGTDRTGVDEDTITVAFHAPETGAAPLPTEAFRLSTDLYWKYQRDFHNRQFLGRSMVDVLFRDDQYGPSKAIQVCRELSARAFLVGGGGGTDQIQACGQLAEVDQFPYFSAGVTEAGLETNPWYFAASMSYRQQGLLLAQYIKKTFSGQKFGAIITDTANFEDAVTGFEQGVQQAGLGDLYVGTLRHPKGEQAWINSYGANMAENGAEILYMLTSPLDYIQFAQQNNSRGFDYVGVGVSMGLNAVLPNGCPEVDGGTFFSPFPGLDWMKNNVPEFLEAWRHFEIDGRERSADLDLGFALWAINEQLDHLFQRYEQTFGTDLTREDFRALVENSQIEGKVFPAVQYSPNNHFGGTAVHVLQADCSAGEYKTLATFATGF